MAEENAAVQEPEEAQDSPAARPPLIPAIVVRICIIGGIFAVLAVGAIFLVTDVIAPRLRAAGAPAETVGAGAPGEEGHGQSAAAEKKGKKGKQEEAPRELIAISDLVVNPAGTGGRRYLKVAVGIEVEQEGKGGGAHGAEGGDAPVRDLLIRELSARTLEELTDPVAKEEMRQSLIEGLSHVMHRPVTNLYFTDYVIQ